MAKTIAILGITGTQGGSVAKHFHSLGWNVRGITRFASGPSVQALVKEGFQISVADLDQPDTLLQALCGVEVIFGVTDFWAPYFSSFAELSKISDRATSEHAYAIEVQRGKNLVDAIAQINQKKGSVLERFVFSTLPNFKEVSKGKYDFNYHFDSKAVVSEYLKKKVELWEKSSLLNVGFYTTNMIKYGHLRAGGLQDGKFVISQPGSPNALHPFFVPNDTGIFAELLVRSPPKQDLLGVSEMASYKTYIQAWSLVTGIPGEAKEITVEQADKANPGGIGREAAESAATSAEFGWGDKLVLPTDLDPEIKTTSLKEYMESEDWTTFLKNVGKPKV